MVGGCRSFDHSLQTGDTFQRFGDDEYISE